MARGMELPLNAVVILILVLIVLLIVTLYITGSGKQMFKKLSGLGEQAATKGEAEGLGWEVGDFIKKGWGSECKADSDCNGYTKCRVAKSCECDTNANKCLVNECDSDGDCSDYTKCEKYGCKCEEDKCEPMECADNGDCKGGKTCTNGQCV